MKHTESGQVLIAVVILLAIIVIGMMIVGHGVGVDWTGHAKNCVEVIYNNGVKELVCQ
jgi:hypothetical protein